MYFSIKSFNNIFLSPVSKASREVANLTWKKKSTHPHIWCQRICLSVCNKFWPQLYWVIFVKFNKKNFVKKWCALGEINWNDSGFQMFGIQIVTVSVFLFRNFSLVFLSIDVRSVTKTKKKETTAAKKKKKKETKSRMTIRKKAGDKNRPRAEKNYRVFRIFDNWINMCGLSTICTTVISVPVI